MSNIEKYKNIFMETFDLDESQLSGLTYQSIQEWDSVGHMTLISALEDAFDIMLESDDIISFKTYEQGLEILSKEEYGVKF